MKRFFTCVICALLIFISVPAIPAEASSVAMSYDLALEIYLSLLSLIETGRLASGYDNSIFNYENVAEYEKFISEYNSYLAENSSYLKGITFIDDTNGSSALEDWVNNPWEKDGNIISGGIQYKLSEFDLQDLQDFGSGMNNNSFNEDNNNPFEKIKKVIIGSSAGVAVGGALAFVKNFWNTFNQGDIETYSFNEKYVKTNSNYYLAFSKLNTNGIYQSGVTTRQAGPYDFFRRVETSPGVYTYNFTVMSSSGYIYDYFSVLSGVYVHGIDLNNGNEANYEAQFLYVRNFSSNVPIFNSDADAKAFLINGDFTKAPLNYSFLDRTALINQFQNTLPLIDTSFRPYGFIGLNNGLSAGRNALSLGEDIEANTDLWADTLPDIVGDIIPEYDPDIIPVPVPDPLPDPLPDPSPDPEPDPEPLPEPDPVPDDGDLTEIPMVTGLEKRFPFSIPWDLKNLVSNLSAEREAPHFEYDFYISERWLPPNGFIYHFDIDLSSFDNLASIFRRLFLISFIVGLAVYSYAKFFGGGE